jgi:hypothetical protein
MTIEEEIKALYTADNANWAVAPTKKEYIKSEDERSLNLDEPIVNDDEVIVVVLRSSKSLRDELGGANTYLYEGDIVIHGTNYDQVELAQTRSKTMSDAEYSLQFINQGIDRVEYEKRYVGTIRYEWHKLENDG